MIDEYHTGKGGAMRSKSSKDPLPPVNCKAGVEPQLYMHCHILNGYIWRPCAELGGKLALVNNNTSSNPGGWPARVTGLVCRSMHLYDLGWVKRSKHPRGSLHRTLLYFENQALTPHDKVSAPYT